MNDFSSRIRTSLWWLLPLAMFAVLIGWEIDWGRAVRIPPAPVEPVPPRPVAARLLPDYVIAGGVAARSETVNRTLFNPTRRPAPVAIAVAEKAQMKKGQFTLTGTTVAGDRSLAFLKEQAGGKPRTVKQGDSINGLLVAEVKPDRVRLTQNDDSEVIMLKVATNSRPTPQPAAPAPPVAGAPQQQAPAAGPSDAAQTLAERRRAARAAEAAAAQGGAAPPATPPVAAAPTTPQPNAQTMRSGAGAQNVDPRWNAQFNRGTKN